jgi:hypothetical protein
MAKSKKVANTDIDWYLISIDRLKQIGLIVLLLLLAGGGWWFWYNQKGNPKALAEAAIADARQALNELAGSNQLASHRTDFDRAQKKIDDATAQFNAAKFTEAQGLAVESQSISRSAYRGDNENDARFLTLEGDVQVQKGSAGDFKSADLRTPLMNGDWVKTSDSASAELMFTNGSVYTVGSNALLEIYSQVSPGTTKKTNSVAMTVGSVEVATTDAASTVKTPGSQVTIDSESTTQVGVDKSQGTKVVTMKGTAEVTSTAGGEPVKVASGEKVVASAAGAVSPPIKTTLPPALLSPPDNQVYQIASASRVEFSWDAVAGTKEYQLEVSRSRLFTTLEINARRPKTSAAARVTAEGTFYWRVASIGTDGDVGPFSPFRRFRVSGGGKTATTPTGSGDTTPPPLTMKAPFSVGDPNYIIEGQTEPGATVFINNEEVEVEANGHFKKLITLTHIGRNDVIIKAVDPAGNPTVQSQTVLVQQD